MLQPRVSATRDNTLITKCDGLFNGMKDGNMPQIADATRLNMRTWSEFASWQHLTNDSPYW